MNQNRERMAIVAAGFSALAVLIDFLLYRKTGLYCPIAVVPFCALTAFTSLIAYARLRLARIADDERRDEALARKERVDATLFAAGETEPFTAAKSLEQFEKWVLPVVPVLFALGLGIIAAWLYRDVSRAVGTPHDHLIAAALLGGQSFFIFLLGRFLVGLSRDDDAKLLRGPGTALGLTCFAGLIAGVAAVAAQVGEDDPRWDRYTALALAAIIGALALEQVLRFVIALYSPRHRKPFSTAYESRLGHLIADPTAWARNFASAVDYQFGFNVSESWLYRLFKNALAPLLIFQLLVLYFMSCLIFLGPEEEGVLEHFGKPVASGWKLESGFHFKLPWPFETVQRVPARRVLSTYIGFEMESETNRPAVISWSQPHYKKEDMYLVASHGGPATPSGERSSTAANDAVAASLVSVNIPVEYRVTNLLSFVYGAEKPEKILQAIANRALTQAAARHDLADFLGPRRAEIGSALQARIQDDANRAGLGIGVIFVGMQGVHPPVQVAEAYESVVGAIEQKEATILTARAYTNQTLPVARANSDKTRHEAEAYRTRRSEIASGEVTQFEKRLQAYATTPAVFKTSLYLNMLRDSLTNSRKFIVDAPATKKIMIFNFEEKPYQDLLDLGSPTATEKPK